MVLENDVVSMGRERRVGKSEGSARNMGKSQKRRVLRERGSPDLARFEAQTWPPLR